MLDRFAVGSVNLHMVINFEDKGLAPVFAAAAATVFGVASAVVGIP